MTDLRFLDEAVRELGQADDFAQKPVSTVAGLSGFQSENKTFKAERITENIKQNRDTESGSPPEYIMVNGKYGNYGNSAWAAVAGLFPLLERQAEPRLFDHLDPDRPPGDVPASRWAMFLGDARTFIAAGWLQRALSLGWSIDDLFGADDTRPYARIDRAGLVLLLNGDHVVAIGPEVAAIETRTGARHTYRRRGRAAL